MAHRVHLRARGSSHFVYSGRSVLVTNLDGWVSGAGTEGLYVDNTRVLSRDEVEVDGRRPRPASVSTVGGDALLAYYEAEQSDRVPSRTLYLEVARRLDEGLSTELRLTNYAREGSIRCELAWLLDADFADDQETEQGKRVVYAPVDRLWDAERSRLTFVWLHDRLDRKTVVRIEGAREVRFEEDRVVFPVEVEARATETIVLVAEGVFDDERRPAPRAVFPPPTGGLSETRRRLLDDAPRLVCPNATVQRAWDTAVGDLASLPLGLADGPATPIAGLPLYQQFFGRDALTIAWQALPAMPLMMRDALRANAAWQGRRIDDVLDEEPGKMIHQARWGPMSALGLDPFQRYYGDYATPLDFMVMVGQYALWTNDRETVRSLLPAARKAIEWAERYGDINGDGFLEYQTRSPKGVKHQGWKDSDDAVVDSQGRQVEPPIASSEIQAYWYAGLQQSAVAFALSGDYGYASELLRKAAALKRRFHPAFWMPDREFYAMALGPDQQQVDSISSNTGHLLAAGIVPLDVAPAVARRLMAPDLFSGWGVRTLSSDNPYYNPFSYHRGSVWPVENGTMAFGLARYGFWPELHRLAEGLFALTDLFVGNRLPEAVGGLPRDEVHPHPGIYPYSCEPQGWSASMVLMVMQSLLGVRAIAPAGLLLVDPHLPAWLPQLTLERLAVGRSRVSLRFERRPDGRTEYRVVSREGRLRVLRQSVPGYGDISLGRRALEIVGSLRRA